MKPVVSLSLTPTPLEGEKLCLVLNGREWELVPYSGDSIIHQGSKHHFFSREFSAPKWERHFFYIKDGANDVEVSQQYFENCL